MITDIVTPTQPPQTADTTAIRGELRELTAFVAAVRDLDPDQPTACLGWDVHALLAHVVAGGAEMARLIDECLAGRPVPATATFAEREAPARGLDHDVPLELVAAGGLIELIDRLEPAASVPFTGWAMNAAALRAHVRSELALHRWDLVGSDDVSLDLLGQPELTEHAVRALSSFDVIDERLAARTLHWPRGMPTSIRLHVDGQPDVVVDVASGAASIRIEAATDGPGITTDAAGRLLLLWGRRAPAVAVDLDPIVLGAFRLGDRDEKHPDEPTMGTDRSHVARGQAGK